MAQVSNDGDPKKLLPLTVPKIIEQLERALIDVKYNQTNDNELTFNKTENVQINSKDGTRPDFIGKELMLFEMIGIINGKITELQKKYDKIKTLEDRKEEFISEKADKITEPIQDIIDYAKLAKSGQMEHAQAWENVLGITKKLQNVTTVILDTNRIINNSLKLSSKNDYINEIILECINSVKDSSLKIPIHVGLDHDVKILVDRFRLSQVIQTLLNNSIKYTSKGHIKIESFVAHEQNLFILRIYDTGIGISEEKLEKIFEKDSQAIQIEDISSSKLSLDLCKGIIEAQGGNISVKNNLGIGCTFTISLPIKQNNIQLH